ncbi:MAG: hypothetical protein IPL46_21035 [Saprospiraceae bacterium]|nr:hypothetical protein [Saprospiraceae bacterium]
MEFAAEFIGGEVGNYVWCDGNGNGIQDPEEFGIDGIMLTLHDKEDGDALVDMKTSINGGQFIFTDLLPNHNYSIRIDLAKLETLGFSGLVPDPDQGGDDELDSDGDASMLPGYAMAMFTTGPLGENDHSIDFGFLGPVANPCTLYACVDPMGMGICADFNLPEIRACVLPAGINNNVTVFAGLLGDSLINPITAFPIRVCGPDSCVYARVSLPGDDMCYSIAKITLSIVDPNGGTMPEYVQIACDGTDVDLGAIVTDNGFNYSSIAFYSDVDKNLLILNPEMYTMAPPYPDTVFWSADLTGGLADCPVMGTLILLPSNSSLVEAGMDDTICGFSCVDLTSLGASFNPNGTLANEAIWSTSGSGTFMPGPRFGEATMYCPDTADVLNGSVVLTLTVVDDPCLMISDFVNITIQPGTAMIIPGESDTIDCTHPFVLNQEANDTFPGCRMVFECYDTLVGSVVDYDLLIGDCEDIIKQIKRTFKFVYDKQEYFCMDTISVRALPDTIICPPMRDSVYCHTGYLKDENGHPSPLVTGFPLADSIHLWPAPPSVCDILVIYKDTEFNSSCPITIKREWFIKNGCTGSFDTCVQWLMVFDTIGPYVTKYDTAALFQTISTSSHECYADVYVPNINFADTCSGVKIVKATVLGYGTTIMTYNPVLKCYESHQKFKVPVSEIDFINGQFLISYVTYEAMDSCHNLTVADSFPLFIVDRVKPVMICDKGLNITVSDTIEWVHAESFNEGSWDNCGISLLLARRTDWATACGVNLCDDIHFLFNTEHHDSVWCARLESDKHINPVEAHYQQAIEWLCNDGQVCSYPVLMGWFYDLVKYATLECIEHPYAVDANYLDKLIGDGIGDDSFDDVFESLVLSVIPCVKNIEADSLEAAFFEFFNSRCGGST